MSLQVFVLLIALLFIGFLAGCANTNSSAQADPNSIIREPENSHEVHGEVGVMYGATAR
jgi:hypothetical protein